MFSRVGHIKAHDCIIDWAHEFYGVNYSSFSSTQAQYPFDKVCNIYQQEVSKYFSLFNIIITLIFNHLFEIYNKIINLNLHGVIFF